MLNPLSLFLSPSNHRVSLGTRGPFGLFPLSISLEQLHTHFYCIGQSGQGKSKLFQSILFQMISAGWGCGVFDPHSDLATDLLAQLASYPKGCPWLSQPANRERLIYLDPARTDYIVPCNILKNSFCTPYEIAENVVEAWRRVFPQTLSEAPRFAQILRNAIIVLAACNLSLLELEPLLTDRSFRDRLLARVHDPLVVSFFRHQYDRWGREQAIFVAPVLNKVSAFLFMPQMRAMLGANENLLDWRTILDSGKIVILNLGGFRDEETQRLLGSLFLTSLEQAAFSRSDQPPAQRRPYFCMIDEFPLFCSRDQTSLARILSACRKHRLHVGLAHQGISQLAGERIQGALANAKLKMVFALGRQSAEVIVKELFVPDPKSIKHEVNDVAAKGKTHPVFDPLAEQFEVFTQTIQRLRRRQVLVQLPEQEQVIEVRTLDVPPSRLSQAQLTDIMQCLTQQIGQPREKIENDIVARGKWKTAPLLLQVEDNKGWQSALWRKPNTLT